MAKPEMVEEAQAAYRAGDYRRAAQLFEAAAQELVAAGDELAAAEMKNNCSVAWLQLREADRALQVVLGTEMVFARAGDRKRQAMALGNQAAALEGQGKLDQAASLYQASADLLKETEDSETRSVVLKSLSQVQLRSGRRLQALASMAAALESKKHLNLQEKLLRGLLRFALRMLRM